MERTETLFAPAWGGADQHALLPTRAPACVRDCRPGLSQPQLLRDGRRARPFATTTIAGCGVGDRHPLRQDLSVQRRGCPPLPGYAGVSGISVIIPCRDGAAWLGAHHPLGARPDPRAGRDHRHRRRLDRRIAAPSPRSFGPPVRVEAGPARGAAHAPAIRGARLVASGERLMFLDADDLARAAHAWRPGAGARSRIARAGDRDLPVGSLRVRRLSAWIAAPPTAAAPPRPGQDRLAAWLTGSWSPPCCILWDRAALSRPREAGCSRRGSTMTAT